MPVDLAATVREYVTVAAEEWPDAEAWAHDDDDDDDERVTWSHAIWHLTLALDWQQKLTAATV